MAPNVPFTFSPSGNSITPRENCSSFQNGDAASWQAVVKPEVPLDRSYFAVGGFVAVDDRHAGGGHGVDVHWAVPGSGKVSGEIGFHWIWLYDAGIRDGG